LEGAVDRYGLAPGRRGKKAVIEDQVNVGVCVDRIGSKDTRNPVTECRNSCPFHIEIRNGADLDAGELREVGKINIADIAAADDRDAQLVMR
jgi:hypothetical protein